MSREIPPEICLFFTEGKGETVSSLSFHSKFRPFLRETPDISRFAL